MQNFSSRMLVLVLTSILIGGSGCSVISRPFTPNVNTPSEASNRVSYDYSTVEDISVGNEPLNWRNEEFDAFTQQVTGLIAKRDFLGLDDLASDLRNGKQKFRLGGGWKIRSLYSITSTPNRGSDLLTHISLLQDWKKATGSITARISLAKTFLAWAWDVRGIGYANEVKPEVRSIVDERIEKAANEIGEASEIEERCYGYYDALLEVHKITGASRSQYEKTFQEAISFDRAYQYFFVEKANFLLPRWGGKPGEIVEFAEGLFENLGETEGYKLYYLIAAELHWSKHQDFFKETGLSWRKTKKGFALYEAEHGPTRFRVNEFAGMAWTAKDPQAACNTMKRLTGPNDFDASVWTSREAFDARMKDALNAMCLMPRADNQAL